LIQRGACTFVEQVLNAQNMGAAAVIVYNDRDGDALSTMGEDDDGHNILAVFISENDGNALAAAVSEGTTTVSLSCHGCRVFAVDGMLHFRQTESWGDWQTTDAVNITLGAGANTVTLRSGEAGGGQIDALVIEHTAAATVHAFLGDAAGGWNGDSVQVAFSSAARAESANGWAEVNGVWAPVWGAGGHMLLYSYALQEDGSYGAHKELRPCLASADCTHAAMSRNEAAKVTVFEIGLPASALGQDVLAPGFQFGLAICVNDGDAVDACEVSAVGSGEPDVPSCGPKGWSGWAPYAIAAGLGAENAGVATLVSAEGDLGPNFFVDTCPPGWVPHWEPGMPIAIGGDESECVQCPAGTKETSEAGCVACPVGSHSPAGVVMCDPCTSGWYDHDMDSSTVCAICPLGRVSGESASECTQCAIGTSPNADASSCNACWAGKYSDGTTPCRLCRDDTYSDAVGAAICTGRCPPETHAPWGATSESDCVTRAETARNGPGDADQATCDPTLFDPGNCLYTRIASIASMQEAELACVSLGGHLASVHSDAQRDAIGAIGANSWIGLNDMHREAGCDATGFLWTDGSATDYTNWADGEPNDWHFGGAGVMAARGNCNGVSGGVSDVSGRRLQDSAFTVACDETCGCGYEQQTYDLYGGSSEQFSMPGQGIENCARVCNEEAGCIGFEYNHGGDEDFKCGTYRTGVNTGAMQHSRWTTCVITAPHHDSSKCRDSDGGENPECCAGATVGSNPGYCADDYKRTELGACGQGHSWCDSSASDGSGGCTRFTCAPSAEQLEAVNACPEPPPTLHPYAQADCVRLTSSGQEWEDVECRCACTERPCVAPWSLV
jgi:hypothetical protein